MKITMSNSNINFLWLEFGALMRFSNRVQFNALFTLTLMWHTKHTHTPSITSNVCIQRYALKQADSNLIPAFFLNTIKLSHFRFFYLFHIRQLWCEFCFWKLKIKSFPIYVLTFFFSPAICVNCWLPLNMYKLILIILLLLLLQLLHAAKLIIAACCLQSSTHCRPL